MAVAMLRAVAQGRAPAWRLLWCRMPGCDRRSAMALAIFVRKGVKAPLVSSTVGALRPRGLARPPTLALPIVSPSDA
jgi:hypothetical protein